MRRHPALFLLLLTLLAYGLLLPWMGFYWDDLPMSWIRYQLGPEAMARYFSSNRPVWGLLYALTTRLLPQVPIYWQVFALLARWLSGVLFWKLLAHLWPKEKELALWGSAFFLLYPGFNQQWIAYLYSHFFIVLDFFLLSLLLMLKAGSVNALHPAADSPRRQGAFWHALALFFSALNLWMMEYFFFLELVRPFLLYTFLSRGLRRREDGPGKVDWHTFLRLYLPYGLLWAVAVLWRIFVFNNQVYTPSLLSDLRESFFSTALRLLGTTFTDLGIVLVHAWLRIFALARPTIDGPRTTIAYWGVVFLAGVLVAVAGRFAQALAENTRQQPQEHAPKESARRATALSAIVLGIVALLVAGWPFWLADLKISLAIPANRFTLPFSVGASLVLAGALLLIPRNGLRLGLGVLIISLAVGRHFLWADLYRRDWNVQKNLFWQMSWRAPGLAPHTIVLLNEGALQTYADNSLGAALNWIYAPSLHSSDIPYALFYPTNRLEGALPRLEPGLPVRYDFLAGEFRGSTSQVVAFYFQPPGCLRLLDPEIDSLNRLIPPETLMREAARLSDARWVLFENTAQMPMIYAPEPPHNWCYYFQKADLARQQGDWAQVVALGEKAFRLGDYPNDPTERFPFIEGYAHLGRWEKALELARQAYAISPRVVAPSLCRLWERIQREASLPETIYPSVKQEFGCFTQAGWR